MELHLVDQAIPLQTFELPSAINSRCALLIKTKVFRKLLTCQD